MKIIQKLLNKYYSQTLFGIIGFSLGSVLILYPGYSLNFESLISIILLILGFIIGKNIKQHKKTDPQIKKLSIIIFELGKSASSTK